MHTPFAAPSTMPSEWLYELGTVVIAGAVLPFLLSVLLDAVALGIQRRRWRLLIGLLAAIGATHGALSWTTSLARTSRTAYAVDRSELVALLFGVGMVVALWHGIPRAMRSVLRRRREDRERAEPATVGRDGAAAARPQSSALAVERQTLRPHAATGSLVLTD